MGNKIRTSAARSFVALSITLTVGGVAPSCQAQSLGWEGETGIFITPLAYTAAPDHGMGLPVVAFHYLNGGAVLGNFYGSSVTVGFAKRFEFGYTREYHSQGDDIGLSPLWHSGFNVVHGKANLLQENFRKKSWIPSVSAGFILRTQVHNVGGALTNTDTHNADVYLVASKTVTLLKHLPIVVNGGYRRTNGEILALGGNAANFTGRAFGAVAFVLKGPKHGTFFLASEIQQQPRHPAGLPEAIIPTTFTYAIRYVPLAERKLSVDFGIAQAAGTIEPGVNLRARAQAAVGVSYGF